MTEMRFFAAVGGAAAIETQDVILLCLTEGGLCLTEGGLWLGVRSGLEALLNELLGGANVLGGIDGVRRLLFLGIALILTGRGGGIYHCLHHSQCNIAISILSHTPIRNKNTVINLFVLYCNINCPISL